MHNLEFNVGTGSIHQLPQTTGDGIQRLLQEVMWNVGDNFPNPVLQLFQCVRFCPVHLLLSPAPRHHLCTATTEFHTSLTVKLQAIFVLITRAASLGHCPTHRRAIYKIIFREVYSIYIIFIMIALILQNV